MKKYAHYIDGKIAGWTSHPNATSSTPIDENSKEWKDFEKAMAEKESKALTLNKLAEELESRFPGIVEAAKAR